MNPQRPTTDPRTAAIARHIERARHNAQQILIVGDPAFLGFANTILEELSDLKALLVLEGAGINMDEQLGAGIEDDANGEGIPHTEVK